MSKQRFHFRQRQTAKVMTSISATSPASLSPLSSERCAALADELETIRTQIGAAVEAIRALAAAGGELEAPLAVRLAAHQALGGMAHALNEAPDLLSRTLAGGKEG